jgi:hypothetical protein
MVTWSCFEKFCSVEIIRNILTLQGLRPCRCGAPRITIVTWEQKSQPDKWGSRGRSPWAASPSGGERGSPSFLFRLSGNKQMGISPEQLFLIVFTLGMGPAGKPAVDTADALAVPAGRFGGFYQNSSRFIAVGAPVPLAMPAGCGFIDLLPVSHQTSSCRKQEGKSRTG